MALPSCVKCDGKIFEVVTKEPLRSNYKLNFVQCASCGGVVGVLEFLNLGNILQKIAKVLRVSV